MAEAIATMRMITNIIQLISFESELLESLNDFDTSISEVPTIYRNIKSQFPPLLRILQETEEQVEVGVTDTATPKALPPVLDGCFVQAKLLDGMVNRILTTLEDSSWQRVCKSSTALDIVYKSQAIERALKHIATKLNLPNLNDLSLNAIGIVSEWLDERGIWLLVFDSTDDVGLFSGCRTMAGQHKQSYEYVSWSEDGTIVIATPNKRVCHRLTDREDPIMVSLISISDASALLRSTKMRDQILNAETTEYCELREVLGRFPYAVTQAAAFITERNSAASEHLQVLPKDQSEVGQLLSEESGDHRRYLDSQSSIMNTCRLPFDQMVIQKPLIAGIWYSIAFLDPTVMIRSLIKRDDVRTVYFISALGNLPAFSLISAEKGAASLEMHQLVQFCPQRWLRNPRSKWRDDVLEIIPAIGDFNIGKEDEMPFHHALTAINYPKFSNPCKLHRATLLHNLARLDSEQSRYELAEKRYTEVIANRKRHLG